MRNTTRAAIIMESSDEREKYSSRFVLIFYLNRIYIFGLQRSRDIYTLHSYLHQRMKVEKNKGRDVEFLTLPMCYKKKYIFHEKSAVSPGGGKERSLLEEE